MKTFRIFLTLSSILAAFFGLALLFAPDVFTSGQGVTLTANGFLFARTLGAAVFATAVVTWYARDLKDRKMMQGVLLMNVLVLASGAIIDAMGIMQGLVPASGWGNIIFRSLLTLGFVYFLVKNPLKKTL